MTPAQGARSVDDAMSQDRPEKQAVRELWLNSLINYANAFPNDAYPLYLTLSGAEGRDIQLLIDNGLLELTEAGSVASSMKHRVIAVESNTRAVVELNRRFPGLKIFEQPFKNLVRSESATRWPDGQDERFCRARVVNLDLNQSLNDEGSGGELRFPILLWIQKLSQLHAQDRIEWSLCLTLHGEIPWSPQTCRAIQEYLAENFAREPSFKDACRRLLEDELFDAVLGDDICLFYERALDEQQRLLMAVVPKKIVEMVYQHGWKAHTSHNLRYGGSNGRAPMVTWIIDFAWEPRAFQTPDAVYRESLSLVLSGAGRIAEDGTIS
jgi:hypothetical protein